MPPEEEIGLVANPENTNTQSSQVTTEPQQPVVSQPAEQPVQQSQSQLLTGGYEYMPQQVPSGADLTKADIYPSDDNIMVGQASLPGLGTIPQYVARGGLYPIGIHYAVQKAQADDIAAQQKLLAAQQAKQQELQDKAKFDIKSLQADVYHNTAYKDYQINKWASIVSKYGGDRVKAQQSKEYLDLVGERDTFKGIIDEIFPLATKIKSDPSLLVDASVNKESNVLKEADKFLNSVIKFDGNPDELKSLVNTAAKLKTAVYYNEYAKNYTSKPEAYMEAPSTYEKKIGDTEGFETSSRPMSDSKILAKLESQVAVDAAAQNYSKEQIKEIAKNILPYVKNVLPKSTSSWKQKSGGEKPYLKIFDSWGGEYDKKNNVINYNQKETTHQVKDIFGEKSKLKTNATLEVGGVKSYQNISYSPSNKAFIIDENGNKITGTDANIQSKYDQVDISAINFLNENENGKIDNVYIDSNIKEVNSIPYIEIKGNTTDNNGKITGTITFYEPAIINGSVNSLIRNNPDYGEVLSKKIMDNYNSLNQEAGKQYLIAKSEKSRTTNFKVANKLSKQYGVEFIKAVVPKEKGELDSAYENRLFDDLDENTMVVIKDDNTYKYIINKDGKKIIVKK